MYAELTALYWEQDRLNFEADATEKTMECSLDLTETGGIAIVVVKNFGPRFLQAIRYQRLTYCAPVILQLLL
jgi:hypothetical protein